MLLNILEEFRHDLREPLVGEIVEALLLKLPEDRVALLSALILIGNTLGGLKVCYRVYLIVVVVGGVVRLVVVVFLFFLRRIVTVTVEQVVVVGAHFFFLFLGKQIFFLDSNNFFLKFFCDL